MPYRNIAKGLNLAADHANYLAWLEQDTAQRQAAYAALNSPKRSTSIREMGYIMPFGASTASPVYIPHKIMSADQSKASNSSLASAVVGALSNRITTAAAFHALTTPVNIGTVKKFQFARFQVRQVVTVATGLSASRITKRLYKRNHINSVTASFGQRPTGETYGAATALILIGTLLLPILESTTERCTYSFTPQGD
ncbi:MAG: hypothetical protein V7K67_16590 [Nostoc sp.]|uniref:hypothetical protein n=1 Tax=Nostoc sp. TaxID=1180 RepID=UPI002FF4A7DF